ncbi:hypothetical protein [Nocardioides sp.]|uniref:hypothetical protein n=1 Tax=Nocardioides sp. TaxID=35761 RepID=UPI0035153748
MSLLALVTSIPTAVLARDEIWGLLGIMGGWPSAGIYAAFLALPWGAGVLAFLLVKRGGLAGDVLGPVAGWLAIVWLVAFWPSKSGDITSQLRVSLGTSGIDPDLAGLLVVAAVSAPLVVLIALSLAATRLRSARGRRRGAAIATSAGVLVVWAVLLWLIAGP